MNKFLLLILMLVSVAFNAVNDSVKVNNIVFYFDTLYPVGQFINGDWWVAPIAGNWRSDTVVIDSINPKFYGGQNGWEIDPHQETTTQGYSKQLSSPPYVTYDSTLVPSLPCKVTGLKSIVKILRSEEDSGYGCRGCFSEAAVLTVLDSLGQADSNTFRPPYIYGNKPFYKFSEIDTSLLPSLTKPMNNVPTYTYFTDYWKNLRIDYKNSVASIGLKPKNAFRDDYGASVAKENAEVALLLMLNDSFSTKRNLLIYYLQYGIDGLSKLYKGYEYISGAGHNPGQKIPMVFAATLFNDAAAKESLIIHNDRFYECKLYYAGSNGRVLFGNNEGPLSDSALNYNYWKVMCDLLTVGSSGYKSWKDPYNLIEGGPIPGSNETYQYLVALPIKGSVTVVNLLKDLFYAWHDTISISATERWVDSGAVTIPDSCAHCDSIWSNYGITFGPKNLNGSGGCIADGIGRFPSLHNSNKNGGYYGSKFVDSMWNRYYDYTYPSSDSLHARITVLPSTTVDVGEIVYLDAWNSYHVNITDTITYVDTCRWYYGDGQYLKSAWPLAASVYYAPSTIHQYRKSGVYACTLIVKDTLGRSDTAIQNITVIGDSALTGVEARHPNFNARKSMYISVKSPSSIYNTKSNTFSCYLSKGSDTTNIYPLSDSVDSLVRFLFVMDTLDSGTYKIHYVFRNLVGDTLSCHREKFHKSYNHNPDFGIDYRGYIYKKDSLVFPITPWIITKNEINLWDTNGRINCTNGIGGTYTSLTVNDWSIYIDSNRVHGIPTIGPQRGYWLLGSASKRNVKNRYFDVYAESTLVRGHDSCVLAYGLWDEPNIGGRANLVPPPTLTSWHYRLSRIDDRRPSYCNYYGFDWLDYYGTQGYYYGKTYSYMYSDSLNQFRYSPADIVGLDHYCYEYSTHAAYSGRRIVKEWINAFDKLRYQSMGNVPVMLYVETVDLHGTGYGDPTPAQIKMMAWLGVIHGAVGINWFHYFEAHPTENYIAMKNFTSDIATYKNIILSDSIGGVLDNSNDNSNRVDFTYRKKIVGTDTTHYIFAVRLTEPDSSAYFIQSNEPDTVTTTFTLPFTSSTVTVAGESRTISGGTTFQDKFYKEAVHIYEFTKNNGVTRRNVRLKFNSKE